MSTISDEEFEREVRTLKNLRRRSGSSPGPGELPLDPDLPPPDAFQAGHHHQQQYSSNDDVTLTLPSGDGQEGLFWVPAHLHPELAPGEFRAFLKQHTQVNPTAVEAGEAGEASLSRSPSWLARSRSLSGGLGRKKSMLSRQYTPRFGDKVEEEKVPPLTRRGSQFRGRNGEASPTLQDLQKLEELVENAELGDDPAKMRAMLRRSLTLNTEGVLDDKAPGADDDDVNAPLVLPRPGSIIRRTARTKIRKGGPGEGGSRRFSGTRRHPRLGSPSSPIDGDDNSPRPSEDGARYGDERWTEGSRSEEGHSVERGSDETSEERSSESPHASAESADKVADTSVADSTFASDDSNDEALIFDAYAHERTPSATSSASEYDVPSRSPSPADTPQRTATAPVPIVAPIATPKINDGAWYEDEELTPTQDSSMSAALHAMTLLPSSGPSSDIFQQPPQQAGRQAIVHRDPVHPHQQRPSSQSPAVSPAAPSSLASPGATHPTVPRIDTRPSVLQPGTQMTQSPAEMQNNNGLPPGMASPARPAPSPSKSEPDVRHAAAPPAVVVERPPLTRVESAASTLSTSSGREKVKEKEKEKKHGLFGSKKDKKDKEKDKKKEKDRFLGSLFGSKKKSEESSSVSNFSTAGPAAAAALLGTSKSAKSLQHSGASSPTSPGFSNFARYPIHVERAVYRLSHIKLANARRPLIEQVLISNLMFWYLGVIGRNPTQNEEKKGVTNGLDKNREETARNPQLKGTPPKPADSGSAGTKRDDPPPPVRKTGGLTKPERSRTTNAEAAYRAPQYGAQTAQMEKEAARGPSPGREQQREQAREQPPPVQQSRQPVMHQQQPPQPQTSPPPHQHYPPQVSQPPRSSSVPGRARSPPQQSQQGRPEYPPGVAPPRTPPQAGGQYGPPMGGQGRPMSGDPRQRAMTGPQPGQYGGPPRQGQPYPQNGPPRQGEPGRPLYPQHSGSSSKPSKHAGPQPGQIFQYPGMNSGPQYQRPPGAGGPQPGQLFNAPGQVFHHPQQQYPGGGGQRPPPQQGNWQPPQRLPPGSPQRIPPGATMIDVPPRRSSGNPDAYGHRPYPRDGSTSPTQQHFYAPGGNQRPVSMQPGQYQYAPPPPGQSRQPVASGQYPHHR